ncbi:MAG: trypsin-like peptidase domain-containing protein [Myxococcota bacterium]
MATLRDLSDGIAQTIGRVGASVVEIRGRRRPSSGIVWSDDRVVTAAHTLHREENIVLVLPNGEERAAVIVGVDLGTDLALLKVHGGGLTAASWADLGPQDVPVGSLVFPLGRGQGRVRTGFGVVADRAGSWTTVTGGEISGWIDVDCALPSGFSGGPLVDADGHVIGLNTSGLTPRGAVLPKATVERVVARLEQFGTVAPGYLGAGFQGHHDALVAVSIEPGGPSEAAGLRVGDVLARLDGQAVGGVRHLLALLAAKGAGAQVRLAVVRDGVDVDVDVTLGARPRPKHACG